MDKRYNYRTTFSQVEREVRDIPQQRKILLDLINYHRNAVQMRVENQLGMLNFFDSHSNISRLLDKDPTRVLGNLLVSTEMVQAIEAGVPIETIATWVNQAKIPNNIIRVWLPQARKFIAEGFVNVAPGWQFEIKTPKGPPSRIVKAVLKEVSGKKPNPASRLPKRMKGYTPPVASRTPLNKNRRNRSTRRRNQ